MALSVDVLKHLCFAVKYLPTNVACTAALRFAFSRLLCGLTGSAFLSLGHLHFCGIRRARFVSIIIVVGFPRVQRLPSLFGQLGVIVPRLLASGGTPRRTYLGRFGDRGRW